MIHFGDDGRRPACMSIRRNVAPGGTFVVTLDAAGVTCARCKKTRWFRSAELLKLRVELERTNDKLSALKAEAEALLARRAVIEPRLMELEASKGEVGMTVWRQVTAAYDWEAEVWRVAHIDGMEGVYQTPQKVAEAVARVDSQDTWNTGNEHVTEILWENVPPGTQLPPRVEKPS